MNKCRWCDLPAIQSHIIPAALLRFMKKQDKNYTLRELDNPNLPLQDILKPRLLCALHDRAFSDSEDKFVSEIFRPLQNGGNTFPYSEWLGEVAVFIAWKRLSTAVGNYSNLSFDEVLTVNKALEHWQRFLLKQHSDVDPYRHYLFLTKLIQKKELRKVEHLLLSDNFGSSVYIGTENILVVTLMPGCMLVSPLKPDGHFEEGGGTRILRTGQFGPDQNIPGQFLRAWLKDKYEQSLKAKNAITARQWEKILVNDGI